MRNASARYNGLPHIFAPPSSAKNSLVREIAILIMVAATGARIIIAISATGFPLPPLPPPKNKAKYVKNVIAVDIVAAIDPMRMSLCLICGNPLYLAEALRKLDHYSGRSQLHVSEQVADSTAHMFILNPLSGKGLASLFSTHPPMEKRIAKLEDMAMGRS